MTKQFFSNNYFFFLVLTIVPASLVAHTIEIRTNTSIEVSLKNKGTKYIVLARGVLYLSGLCSNTVVQVKKGGILNYKCDDGRIINSGGRITMLGGFANSIENYWGRLTITGGIIDYIDHHHGTLRIRGGAITQITKRKGRIIGNKEILADIRIIKKRTPAKTLRKNKMLIETKLAKTKLAKTKLAKKKLAEKKLAEKQLAEKQLAETKLAETKLAEKQLAEKILAEKRLAEKRLAEKRLAEKILAEKILAEKILAEKKLAEKKLAEKQLAEKQLAEKKLAEKQLAEKQLVEKKLAEKKLAEVLAKHKKLNSKKISNKKIALKESDYKKVVVDGYKKISRIDSRNEKFKYVVKNGATLAIFFSDTNDIVQLERGGKFVLSRGSIKKLIVKNGGAIVNRSQIPFMEIEDGKVHLCASTIGVLGYQNGEIFSDRHSKIEKNKIKTQNGKWLNKIIVRPIKCSKKMKFSASAGNYLVSTIAVSSVGFKSPIRDKVTRITKPINNKTSKVK